MAKSNTTTFSGQDAKDFGAKFTNALCFDEKIFFCMQIVRGLHGIIYINDGAEDSNLLAVRK